MSGFWVATVDRVTGQASTELFAVKDEAWQAALDIGEGRPDLYTTVVRQLDVAKRR